MNFYCQKNWIYPTRLWKFLKNFRKCLLQKIVKINIKSIFWVFHPKINFFNQKSGSQDPPAPSRRFANLDPNKTRSGFSLPSSYFFCTLCFLCYFIVFCLSYSMSGVSMLDRVSNLQPCFPPWNVLGLCFSLITIEWVLYAAKNNWKNHLFVLEMQTKYTQIRF